MDWNVITSVAAIAAATFSALHISHVERELRDTEKRARRYHRYLIEVGNGEKKLVRDGDSFIVEPVDADRHPIGFIQHERDEDGHA